jgi:hypothetical protein
MSTSRQEHGPNLNGVFRNACPLVIDEIAIKNNNGVIPDLVLQVAPLSRDENSLAGCDHLADTKTLNASKHHYHKKSTNFGFAVNLRQTEVKSEYRKKAGKLTSLVRRRCPSPF